MTRYHANAYCQEPKRCLFLQDYNCFSFLLFSDSSSLDAMSAAELSSLIARLEAVATKMEGSPGGVGGPAAAGKSVYCEMF